MRTAIPLPLEHCASVVVDVLASSMLQTVFPTTLVAGGSIKNLRADTMPLAIQPLADIATPVLLLEDAFTILAVLPPESFVVRAICQNFASKSFYVVSFKLALVTLCTAVVRDQHSVTVSFAKTEWTLVKPPPGTCSRPSPNFGLLPMISW